MQKLDPWYITGFCDGEAAFTYSRTGGAFNLYFSLRQREDNREIVERIWKFFDYIGNIYKSKGQVPEKEGYPDQQDSAYFRVARVDQLLKVVEHFDKYPLQGKKQNAYLVWRKMVIYKDENFRNTDYNILRELVAELAKVNQKSRAFKIHRK
ncbi:MAG: hypothetical protein A2Y00_05160 [Omnitrophica WOR_2 bacterium GWF2_43_52]|nr:MAG: hypothetical protein A2062_00700 [Omnitrophica WOR_2 bacterium GWA2_44_7]OGX18058.1 MAG: hypothetical protein A2Y01_02745 [Omnitrophica WOR_2 bacterium GWC2_44_8]OGX20496.1 MAG: hypothetical protein A2Y00_05160 [Omnitrophica WOR_2 bacterium GWF2_43_52]OGX56090.1 MAG: hypothetical protein A2460_08780 [Omnitrophica WOR_2 bacterium RIFOXYC2_FULL_43_9]HAH20551.1 hypothetical protein [Candidatus Omnitrophota bacterium]